MDDPGTGIENFKVIITSLNDQQLISLQIGFNFV